MANAPTGMKLVPIELTTEMVKADPYGMGYGRLHAIWSRLLAAAPQATAPLPVAQPLGLPAIARLLAKVGADPESPEEWHLEFVREIERAHGIGAALLQDHPRVAAAEATDGCIVHGSAHPCEECAADLAGTQDLCAAIMNLPCDASDIRKALPEAESLVMAYQMGHRDARHAAAELVAASPSGGMVQAQVDAKDQSASATGEGARIAELEDIVRGLRSIVDVARQEWMRAGTWSEYDEAVHAKSVAYNLRKMGA